MSCHRDWVSIIYDVYDRTTQTSLSSKNGGARNDIHSKLISIENNSLYFVRLKMSDLTVFNRYRLYSK